MGEVVTFTPPLQYGLSVVDACTRKALIPKLPSMEDQRTLDYLFPCNHEDGIARWSDTYAKGLGRTILLEANAHGLRGQEIPTSAACL